MTSSATIRDHLRPRKLRLRPSARRRALVAGLATGPLAAGGAGFAWIGVQSLATTPGPSSWVFAGIGTASLVAALAAGAALLRTHHRGTLVAALTTLVTGLPFAVLAPSIVATVILGLATASGEVAPVAPPLVFGAAWAAVAAPGLVLGPLAAWWIAHRTRHLPSELASDARAVARFEATSEPVDADDAGASDANGGGAIA